MTLGKMPAFLEANLLPATVWQIPHSRHQLHCPLPGRLGGGKFGWPVSLGRWKSRMCWSQAGEPPPSYRKYTAILDRRKVEICPKSSFFWNIGQFESSKPPTGWGNVPPWHTFICQPYVQPLKPQPCPLVHRPALQAESWLVQGRLRI